MNKIVRTLNLILFLLPAIIVKAQIPGTLDPSFNPIDKVMLQGEGFNGGVATMVRLANGKILCGGNHNTYNGLSALKIARINPDGSLDTSFFGATGLDNDVYTLHVLQDGKILAGGAFTKYAGSNKLRMVRLFSNGTLDTTFNPAFNNNVNHFLVQPDGKIIAVGTFTTVNGLSRNKIIRLMTDGTIDTTFKIETGFGGQFPNFVSMYPDSSILVGGNFTSYNGRACGGLVRLFKNGTMDTSLQIGTGFNNVVKSCLPTPERKILAVGNFTQFNGKITNGIVRLDSLGKWDSTFATGAGFDSLINSMELLPNGDIVVMGYFNKYKGFAFPQIVKIKPDGSYDLSFKCGSGTQGRIHCMAVEPDGNLILGGYMPKFNNTSRKHLIRINPLTATVDISFNPITGANGYIVDLLEQGDGKILVAGYSQIYNNQAFNGLFRVFADGSIDSGFVAPLPEGAYVHTITQNSAGKIYAAGDINNMNLTGKSPVVRLLPNGSIDNSFSSGNGFNNLVQKLLLQSDGKVWVGGVFTYFNGVSRNYLARLNENGSLDSSINLGTGFNAMVSDLKLQSDGKLLVAGNFTTYKGLNCKRITRLLPNGDIDTTFNTGTGMGAGINRMVLQPDGKIICVGSFTSFNGVNKTAILRLMPNGSLDTSFNNGFNGGVFTSILYQAALQADGKIVFIGNITAYRGTQIRNIARIFPNGRLDTSFVTGNGLNTTNSTALILLKDEKFMIGGSFSSYNGIAKNKLLRLFGGNMSLFVKPISHVNFCVGDTLFVPVTVLQAFDTSNQFTAQLSDSSGSFANPTDIGQVTGSITNMIPATLPHGSILGSKYRIRVRASNPSYTSNDNGANISINIPLNPVISGPDSVQPKTNPGSIYLLSNMLGTDSISITINPSNAGSIIRNGLNLNITWNQSYSGPVQLSVKGINGCGVGPEFIKNIQLLISTGMNQILEHPFVCFPNPAESTITVQLPENFKDRVLEVFNLQGELVQRLPVSLQQEISVSSWHKGIYFFKIGTQVEKIIIH